MSYALGKHAYGFCDRCSWRYPLDDLKYELANDVRNGLRVCPECYDEDHPQDDLDKLKVSDPQALRDPRPDPNRADSLRLFSWNPVGNQDATSIIRVKLGIVSVS